MSDRSRGESALVQFSERLTNSAAFGALFREGMDLVEETAAYLDGIGRSEAKALDRAAGGESPAARLFMVSSAVTTTPKKRAAVSGGF